MNVSDMNSPKAGQSVSAKVGASADYKAKPVQMKVEKGEAALVEFSEQARKISDARALTKKLRSVPEIRPDLALKAVETLEKDSTAFSSRQAAEQVVLALASK